MTSSDDFFYCAYYISGHFPLKTCDPYVATISELSLNIFYLIADIDIDNAGNGKKASLKPVLGLKIGYLFEGFWKPKEKK